MSNLATNKLQACKFDYEYMGRSVEALVQTYGYPRNLIENEINQGEWIRKLDRLEVPETKDLAEFADKLREVAKARLNVVVLMSQIENQSMVQQLEKMCLEKAMDLLAGLDSEDPKSVQALKGIVSTINTLQDRNPVNLADNIKDIGEDTGKIMVQIVNNV